MAIGNIRNIGGGAQKNKIILSPLNELMVTQPSNTASAQTTKRTFIKNSIIMGMSAENYYNTSAVSLTGRSSTTISYNGQSGYGFSLCTNCEKGRTYSITYQKTANIYASRLQFYAEDGTFLSATGIGDNTPTTFTVPSNAEYVLIQSGAIGSGTFTLTELKEVV